MFRLEKMPSTRLVLAVSDVIQPETFLSRFGERSSTRRAGSKYHVAVQTT